MAAAPAEGGAPAPRVSVIIPTWNGSRFLPQTVVSVLAQSLADFELIIVDDGSDEDVAALLPPLEDRRLRLVRQARAGPARARNHGLRLARGEYIAWLDHDDLYLPEKLSRQVALLDAAPDAAMAYSYHRVIDAAGAPIPHQPPAQFPSGRVFADFLRRNRITTFGETLIRRAALDDVGPLEEDPRATGCDDYDMWLRIADRHPVLYSPPRDLLYRVHEGNLARQHLSHLQAHLFVFRKALANCRSVGDIPSTELRALVRDHLHHQYSRHAYRLYDWEGNARAARRLAWRCVLLRPLHGGTLALLGHCLLPPAARAAGAAVRRRLRRRATASFTPARAPSRSSPRSRAARRRG